MSRLATLSPAALKAMFSPDADDSLITLLTITGTGISPALRIADGYTQRISEDSEDVLYGVVSRTNNYIFLPFQISLPTEEVASAPRCTISITDVTRYLLPTIRSISSTPSVKIELVLSASPDTVEATFDGFQMGSISYNSDGITAELSVASLTQEPFPAHTFTPSYFPGLF